MTEANTTAAERPVAGRPPYVLVVDDATVVRLYYRGILEAAGCRVEEAINGMEAMERALRTPFDLCVVDVNMPLMDGYLFLHSLRREPVTRGIPALMTSTQSRPADLAMARSAGANFYLVKPVPPDLLTAVTAAMLGRTVA